MVTNGNAVSDTMNGPAGALDTLQPGCVWIQMGTIGVEWTERFEKLAADHDIEFVDAPVSGSSGPAIDGTLIVLCSGPEAARERVQPIFDAIGSKTLWLDSHLFLDAIDGEPLGSPYAVAKGRAMIAGDYTPGFAMKLGYKDVGLALDAARAAHLELPLTVAVAGRFQKAMADGHADEDVSSVFAEAQTQTQTQTQAIQR